MKILDQYPATDLMINYIYIYIYILFYSIELEDYCNAKW